LEKRLRTSRRGRVTPDDVTRQRAAIVAAFVFPVKKDELLAAAGGCRACAPALSPSSAQSVAATPVQLREQSRPLQQYELRLDSSKNVSALEQELEQCKAHVQGLLTTNAELVVHALLAAATAEAELVKVKKDAADSRRAAVSALEKQGTAAAAQAETRYNLLLAENTSIQCRLSTATVRPSRHVALLAKAARQRIKRKARCSEMMKEAKEKQDKQLDRVHHKVCSAELKLAEEHAVRLPAQASASAAGTSEASTKREALNVTRQLEINTKILAALQRASKQATTAKTAAQAKANNLQVKIDASIKLRGASESSAFGQRSSSKIDGRRVQRKQPAARVVRLLTR
jgi:hypothetical protein